jgi:hypothetical protein
MERTHNLKVYLWCSFFLFVVGETLHFKDTSNGYINVRGSKAFKFFLNCCDLLEYPFHGHRYTWFRGSLMSRIDRDFATPDCFLHFPDLSFSRYPRGLSDHCHLVIGSAIQKWGWRPFRFLDCWVSHPWFMKYLDSFWEECGCTFHGTFQLIRKLS